MGPKEPADPPFEVSRIAPGRVPFRFRVQSTLSNPNNNIQPRLASVNGFLQKSWEKGGIVYLSRAKSLRFQANPPVKPPREPSDATTRWQGTTRGTGLAARAWPAALAPLGLPA